MVWTLIIPRVTLENSSHMFVAPNIRKWTNQVENSDEEKQTSKNGGITWEMCLSQCIPTWAHVRCSPMHILCCSVYKCSHLSSDESASECIWTWLVVCLLSVHKSFAGIAQWVHACVCVCVCTCLCVRATCVWRGSDVPWGWDLACSIKAMLHVVTELWSTMSKRRIT